jgi:hypothetical protein
MKGTEMGFVDVPGSGGKRMARTPRKMSAEHMVALLEFVLFICSVLLFRLYRWNEEDVLVEGR